MVLGALKCATYSNDTTSAIFFMVVQLAKDLWRNGQNSQKQWVCLIHQQIDGDVKFLRYDPHHPPLLAPLCNFDTFEFVECFVHFPEYLGLAKQCTNLHVAHSAFFEFLLVLFSFIIFQSDLTIIVFSSVIQSKVSSLNFLFLQGQI